MTVNRQLVLRSRPDGDVSGDNFELVTGEIPTAGEGEVVLRNLWLAFEPAQRGWLNDVRSYVPPVGIGEVMRSWGIGQVVESNVEGVQVGDLATAHCGWQDYAVVRPSDPGSDWELVPADLDDPTLMLTAGGITGLTAYFGMTEIGRPVAGDTVLVTAAAGATGSVAGQIARILGAETVIGTAGSPEKQAWVTDVAGFDHCLSHHDDKFRRSLAALVGTDGVDVVFDNVGGKILDAALVNIAERGRLALCGAISTGYRPEKPEHGLHYYQVLTTRQARMEGFLVLNYKDRFPEARAQLFSWVAEGKLTVAVDLLEDLEQAPAALQGLFSGRNLGKQLLKLADPA